VFIFPFDFFYLKIGKDALKIFLEVLSEEYIFETHSERTLFYCVGWKFWCSFGFFPFHKGVDKISAHT
jgi:hypothetical protein